MMSHSAPYIGLLDAITRATAAGVSAELLSGVELQSHELLVAVETSDPDPLLSIRRQDQPLPHGDELLALREASGPDRWDYPLAISCQRERLVLRLSRGAVMRDVPIAPAAVAVLRSHGWRDDPTLLAPTIVAREEFTLALEVLTEEAKPQAPG